MLAYSGRAYSAHVPNGGRGQAACEQVQDVPFTCGQPGSVTGLGLDAGVRAEGEAACLVEGYEGGLQQCCGGELVVGKVTVLAVESSAHPRPVRQWLHGDGELMHGAERDEQFCVRLMRGPVAQRDQIAHPARRRV